MIAFEAFFVGGKTAGDMEMEIRCTIGDVIGKIKGMYLESGEKAVYADEGWCVYEKDDILSLNTVCCIAEPPGYDEETEEEIFPAFAAENGMEYAILSEIIQDVVISALEQKHDASDEEILNALNYYLEYDAFMRF